MIKLYSIKIMLLFFAVALISLSTTACSDVAGPDSSSTIISEETPGLEELRRRTLTIPTGGESTTPSSCTLASELLGYGFDKNQTGTVTPSFDGNGNLLIKFQAIGNWEFSETKVYVSNVPPSGGGWQGFDSVTHTPKVTEVTRVVNISSFGSGLPIYIGAKGQSHNPNVNSGNGQTATAGKEGPFQAHFTYFKITNECPATTSGAFNSTG
jgi:hypothetical protein